MLLYKWVYALTAYDKNSRILSFSRQRTQAKSLKYFLPLPEAPWNKTGSWDSFFAVVFCHSDRGSTKQGLTIRYPNANFGKNESTSWCPSRVRDNLLIVLKCWPLMGHFSHDSLNPISFWYSHAFQVPESLTNKKTLSHNLFLSLKDSCPSMFSIQRAQREVDS